MTAHHVPKAVIAYLKNRHSRFKVVWLSFNSVVRRLESLHWTLGRTAGRSLPLYILIPPWLMRAAYHSPNQCVRPGASATRHASSVDQQKLDRLPDLPHALFHHNWAPAPVTCSGYIETGLSHAVNLSSGIVLGSVNQCVHASFWRLFSTRKTDMYCDIILIWISIPSLVYWLI
ncbi:hypothetical protein AAKU64_004399 [Undibacterium sp. GrIS 1.8]